MKQFDVAIIGGGAAGMACAVELSKRGKLKIAIIEAADRLGKKLACTGNGQGNISNLVLSQERYHGGNTKLVEKIACKNPYAGAKLFNCLFLSDERGRIYPSGKQASALTDSLIKSLNCGGVEVFLSSAVTDIQKGFTLTLSSGEKISARFAVLCTGGIAQPVYKNSSSYELATAFGHKLTKLYPSLVQLKTDTKHIKTLKGIRADCNVSVIVNGETVAKSRGDVIFTEYGISGNAVFSVSSYVADKPDTKICLEFLPDISAEDIIKDVNAKKSLGYETGELLSGTVHNQIGRAVIKRAASADGREIVKTLKNFTLEVLGTLGFSYAQVTKGGIEMGGVSDELESKLVKNLFFAGEVLDVDGDCGGYNLQWAFTSGIAAADAVLKRL